MTFGSTLKLKQIKMCTKTLFLKILSIFRWRGSQFYITDNILIIESSKIMYGGLNKRRHDENC
jgi:hypothetical protein